MENHLPNKIKEWLNKHGYPFELIVAKSFKENGFTIAQSVYYIDKDQNIPREVDLVAYKSLQVANYWISFAFVIECKMNKSKPWVSFLINDTSDLNGNTVVNGSSKGVSLIKILESSSLLENPLFPNERGVFSYSITQALREGDAPDIPFKAIQTVLKAIDHYITKFATKNNVIYFYFPVIALDTELFEATLLPENEIKLDQVSETTLLARNPISNDTSALIKVVTKDSVDDFCKKSSHQIEDFITKHKPRIEELINTQQI